ncbi:hypothetical protein ACQEU5_15595 [Marinactinospora thermotolerans]|uniref:Uncharacterized protein n=1 Tax=Marinactinospora thermotolerans DSM 45154 TaxID=1122192 RepID=A0A1T4T999_9ACTN|nr:hypothetical protein [Marinactinospora thermotolerans]SKA36953.1 hypothetical protein SAMN02745673_04661 [Marinactinospora thermotolerans DSM 45154]
MSKSTPSKATPLSKDIKAIVLTNLVALFSTILFAALGLGVFYAAI